jgi:hypothetical protein
MWRPVLLRGAGFPANGVRSLAGRRSVLIADELVEADVPQPRRYEEYQDVFGQDCEAIGEAVRSIAALPLLRQAITWQNPGVVTTCLDPVIAERGHPRKQRQRRRSIAKYWQRYCLKNETIGFFGPSAWCEWVESAELLAVRPGPRLIGRRAVRFEWWAVNAVAAAICGLPGILPWLPPRRAAGIHLDGQVMVRPHRSGVQISEAETALLSLANGRAAARDIAVEIVAAARFGFTDEADVFEVLADLAARKLMVWTLELPAEEDAEVRLRHQLQQIMDPPIRESALVLFDEFQSVREQVARSVAPTELAAALAAADTVFTRITGQSAQRFPGEIYAGRRILYEECARDVELELGSPLLHECGAALTLLLTSARWLCDQIAMAANSVLMQIYGQLCAASPGRRVALSEMGFHAHEMLFASPASLTEPVIAELRDRWCSLLDVPMTEHRVHRVASALADACRRMFAAPGLGWAAVRHHSIDLMIAAGDADALDRGDYLLVVGELHPGNALTTAGCAGLHPAPSDLHSAFWQDFPGSRVVPVWPGDWRGLTPRLAEHPAFIREGDCRISFGPCTAGDSPAQVYNAGDIVVECQSGKLIARSLEGRRWWPLIEVFGDYLSNVVGSAFKDLWAGPHVPRISLDRVVINRESWSFAPRELAFAHRHDEADRFLEFRRWWRANELPRHLFVKLPVEDKPIYLDSDSPILLSILANLVKASEQVAGAVIKFQEMLPGPDQLWLPDADGERYSSELRVVALDPIARIGGATQSGR